MLNRKKTYAIYKKHKVLIYKKNVQTNIHLKKR